MADGSAEHTGAFVVICPRNDSLAFALCAARNDLGGGEHLYVVVEFLVSGRPVFDSLGDERHVVLKRDRDRLFRAVAGGLQTNEFVPLRVGGSGLHRLAKVTKAVRVHRAMEVYCGDAVAVRCQYAGNDLGIGLRGGAFVVNDDIISLGIVGVAVDG